MSETVDIVIIGAGVVGLAIAEAVATKKRQIVVLGKTIPLDRKQVPAAAKLFMRGSITRKNS